MKAAADARHDGDLLIVARTDAIAVEGFAAAMDRAQAYRDAGADMTFIEAPTTPDEITAIGELPWPQIINIVLGGRTPELPNQKLKELGFAGVLYANLALQASLHGMQAALGVLRRQAKPATRPRGRFLPNASVWSANTRSMRWRNKYEGMTRCRLAPMSRLPIICFLLFIHHDAWLNGCRGRRCLGGAQKIHTASSAPANSTRASAGRVVQSLIDKLLRLHRRGWSSLRLPQLASAP